MRYKKAIFLIIFLILCGRGISSLMASQTPQKPHSWDGSQTTAVHWLQLKDEFDQLVLPSESYALPYSARYSCAPCHDYSVIRQGLHFNANSASEPGRPGEPWIWVEPRTGTVLPLAYRNWPGMWNPQDLGVTAWDFTLLFGRHMTGGGVAEPADDKMSPKSRWAVSGKLEINCMGCHNASRMQSHSEWAKQVMRHNFRWAATASSGLGEVGGMASRLPGTWDLFDGPNPDDSEWAVVPSVRYRPAEFDSKHRVFFDIAPKIDDQRCFACHSVSQVGEKRSTSSKDIHSAAGLGCVDCHRNDINHNMTRGYEGEAEEYHAETKAEFSCRSCHMDEDLSRRGGKTSGRLGAPYPKHAGIPVVHFERLSCTVCHAGPLPDKEMIPVRTSRANRLGIYGVAQWFTEWPHIVEPVFVRDQSGKISPHRLLWPAFWGRSEEENIIPLMPSEVEEAAGEILTVEEAVVSVLKAVALYGEVEGIPVLVLSGKVYEPNVDELLDISDYPGEETVPGIFWAIKTDRGVNPLIPDFDPDAEEPDMDAETRIQRVLEALATLDETPGKPAVFYKKAMYQLTEGYLERGEDLEEAEETGKLVWLKNDEIVPVISDFQVRTVKSIVGNAQTLTEEQVELVLKVLSKGKSREDSSSNQQASSYADAGFVYISGGRVFRLDKEGNLSDYNHKAANPVTWPLGHRVRPAQQSLGINGCQDCHLENSAFFFNRIRGDGPLKTDRVEARSAYSFMDLSKPYQKLFGLSFRVRPLFKVVLFIAVMILGSILLIIFFKLLGQYTGLIQKRK